MFFRFLEEVAPVETVLGESWDLGIRRGCRLFSKVHVMGMNQREDLADQNRLPRFPDQGLF